MNQSKVKRIYYISFDLNDSYQKIRMKTFTLSDLSNLKWVDTSFKLLSKLALILRSSLPTISTKWHFLSQLGKICRA